MISSTVAAAAAGIAAVCGYLNAKHHICKDLEHMYYQHRGERYQQKLKSQGKINIWATFVDNATRSADKDCIWYSDPSTSPSTIRLYSWKQAHEQACRYASWFLSKGVTKGDCVGFYLQNSPDFVLAWMGLLAIGCYPATINYNLVGGALVHCVRIAECKLLLVDEDFQDRVFNVAELNDMGVSAQVVDRGFRNLLSSLGSLPPGEAFASVVDEKTRVALRYTSGTTGHPKGVMATIGRYYSRLESQFKQMGVRPLKSDGSGDRWYICMPMCHSTASSAALICMLMPTTLCIGKKFSASRFWQEVRDSRSTVGTYVGEIARYLLALPASPLDQQHSLRMMYGNGMRPDVWGRFQNRFNVPEICEFYGSTEGGLSHLNIQKGEYLRDAIGHDGLTRRWMIRDQIVPVKIDSETNEIVRDPETGFAIRMPYEIGGELLFRLKDESGFVGYWKNPEATEKKLARNVFRNGDLFYRSGDSLKRDWDGKWSFLDRLGDTFRWKGENVSTAEVSECFGKYDGIVDANIYGIELPNHDGRAGCAALLLHEGTSLEKFNFDALLRHARKDLPHYAIPLFLRIVSKAALNLNELKQDKAVLRSEGVDPGKVCRDPLLVLRNGRYVEFLQRDWDDLTAARAKL